MIYLLSNGTQWERVDAPTLDYAIQRVEIRTGQRGFRQVYMAESELNRTSTLPAFSITGWESRKENKISSIYEFADGSLLEIPFDLYETRKAWFNGKVVAQFNYSMQTST